MPARDYLEQLADSYRAKRSVRHTQQSQCGVVRVCCLAGLSDEVDEHQNDPEPTSFVIQPQDLISLFSTVSSPLSIGLVLSPEDQLGTKRDA